MPIKKKGSEEPIVVVEVEVTDEGKVKVKGKKQKKGWQSYLLMLYLSMGKLGILIDNLRELQFDRAAFLSAMHTYDSLFDGYAQVFEPLDHDVRGNICHDDIVDVLFSINHDSFYIKAKDN